MQYKNFKIMTEAQARILALFTIFALTLYSFGPFFAFATDGYSIILGSQSISDLTLSLSGSAAAHPYQGNLNQQDVSIDWDDDKNASTTNWVDSTSFAPTDSGGSGNNKFFTATWSGNHTYSAPGIYTVKVRVHHANVNGNEGSDVATYVASFTIPDPVNTAPAADAQSITTNEDSAATITLTGSDADSDTLSYAVVAGPTNGALTGTAPNLTYTPNANYNGSDSFTFKANDGTVDSNTATVSITVNAVNDAPVALDDAYSTGEDVVLTGSSVLSNDTDVESNSLTATVVNSTASGALVLNPDGTFTYTPNADFNGSDSFTYQANDGTSNSNTATVNITVGGTNDVPNVSADSYSATEDTELNVTVAAGVLYNDSDSDGDTLTAVLVSGTTNGNLILNSDGSFNYIPNANYNGSDSFTYKANDGQADSSTVTVNIAINAVNDAPLAEAQTITTNEDQTVNITLTGSDVEGSTLTYFVVDPPTNGALSGTIPNLTYTPNADYNGTDSFTFKVNDGTADSTVATVDITVNPADEATENTQAQCTDDIDNDNDGLTDLNDPDCSAFIPPAANTAPVLEILGANPITLTVGTTYVDPGASSTDAQDGDVTSRIASTTDLNVSIVGTYTVTYEVGDDDFATTTGSRIVNVVTASAPENTGGGNTGGGGIMSRATSTSTTTPPGIAPILTAVAPVVAAALPLALEDAGAANLAVADEDTGTTTAVELANVEPANNQLAAAGLLGNLGNWWWLLLLILAIAILGYGYYTWDERKTRIK